MRQLIVSAVDNFIDIRSKPTNSVIELCRTLGIDIALHRNGHTKEARTELFQQKVAPVQISYLGYPGTLGAEFIDYVVADSMVIPSSHRHYYSENVIYMPNSYQPNDDARQISTVECTRAENGLPNNAFVLCCFNQSYKISPREFIVWMRRQAADDMFCGCYPLTSGRRGIYGSRPCRVHRSPAPNFRKESASGRAFGKA